MVMVMVAEELVQVTWLRSIRSSGLQNTSLAVRKILRIRFW